MNLNNYNWNNINLIDIFRVTSSPAGTRFFEHGRTDIFQIGLKVKGSSEIIYNQKKYPFCAGTVLYLPKEKSNNIDYQTTILEQGESICIFFNSTSELPDNPILIQKNDMHTYNLFSDLCGIYNQTCKDTFLCMSVFYNILSSIQQKVKENPISGKDKLTNITEYMQKHVTDKYIDFNTLAENNNISIDHFRHIFRKKYNISPLQYFHLLKIDYIKSLIHNPNYSISDISVMMGFEDLNYFSRFFKKHTGISPSEYKKTYII